MARASVSMSVADIAAKLDLPLIGDGSREVNGLASLESASESDATFLAEDKFAGQLATTSAGLIVLREKHAAQCQASGVLSVNPRLDYARLTQLLFPPPAVDPGVHPTSLIAADAEVDASAEIGAYVVIEAGARVGAGCRIGAHGYLGKGVLIGAGTVLHPRVVLYDGVVLGERCIVHSGAVIGADGFGFAPDSGGQWHKVQQVGRVRVGDRVEVGANTTIDRGAIDDTVIGDGVILDNQIQIGHNVSIGENSAIAGCTGVAGSTQIGARVQIGGHSAVLGHLAIADGVILMGHSVVSGSIREPGVYASVMPVMPVRVWRRLVARFRRLDKRDSA